MQVTKLLMMILSLTSTLAMVAEQSHTVEKSNAIKDSCPLPFCELTSVQSLNNLAINPIDLTENGMLTPNRIESKIAMVGPFQYFYATERVSDAVLSALFDLAEEREVIKKMVAMQSGEVVNFIQGIESENRAALHTAMRDFFDSPNVSSKAREAASLASQEIEKLKDFMSEINSSAKFTDLIHIGIGGSQLGPEMATTALKPYAQSDRHVHFFSNVDPDEGARIVRSVDLSKTLVVIVSKSGTTLETMTNEAYLREQFEKAGLSSKEHIIAVTGKGSPMDDPSRYLASFYMWDYVGGRFSLTSMVGAVTLTFFVGIDNFIDFLKGAHDMDKNALETNLKKNGPLLAALIGIWNRNFLNLDSLAIIPYSQALSRFPAYIQQVDMESNGKHIDKCGRVIDFETSPIIFGEPGTNAQHSFFQMIHQGTTVVPLEFIGFSNDQYGSDIIFKGTSSQEKLLANLFAQAISLARGEKSENPNKNFSGNRPSSILLGKQLNPYTLGALVAFYEHKVVFQGFLWNINSFDQEGVQLGKVTANKLIDQFALSRERKEIDPALFPLGQVFLKHLY